MVFMPNITTNHAITYTNCNFTCEITKLPWQPAVRLRFKMATKFLNVMKEDVRAQKDALENLNTRKSTSRRILRGMLSKNSENLSQISALNV